MDIKLLKGSTSLISKNTFESVFTNWLEAVQNFNVSYKSISLYVNDEIIEKGLSADKNVYIGRCSINQLSTLLATMQIELEKLIQDIDQADAIYLAISQKNCDKMAAHTLILNQLNQQAKILLQLANCTID